MAYAGFLFILALQVGAPSGAAEQLRQPYVIQLKDGTTFVGFWDEKKAHGAGKVKVEVDEPWNARRFEIVTESDVVEKTPEWRQATERRIKKGWEDAGALLIDGRPVARAQFELAQRARQMAGIDSPTSGEGEQVVAEAVPTGAVTTEPMAAPMPGFFEQWGAHVGLLLVAVLLTGLAVRMTFSSTE